MMKYIAHCLTVFILFLAFSLNGQDVQISIDHPDRVNAGEDFIVTVTIRKGSLTDYSRFSQDLPPGLAATNLSSPNADFSFDEQRVRIIWLKLPETPEISVSYSISVDARLKGSFRLGGVFAYVINNERKFLNFDNDKAITIVPSRTIDPSLIVDIGDFKPGATRAPATTTTATTTVPGRTNGVLLAVRQKPVLESTGAYLVHLLINKPTGSKYAKIEETLPSGYKVEEVDSGGGIFTEAASSVKFIWMTLPPTSEFEVVYRLVPIQNETQGNMQIKGQLTYTAGNENKIADVVEMDIPLGSLTLAQKRDLLEHGTIPIVTDNQVVSRRETRPNTTSPNTGSSTSRFIVNTRVLEPGAGTYYRVQLSANLNAIDATTFYREAGVNEEVQVEQNDGFYKYTVGPFQSYEEALSYRNRVEMLPEVEGSFVVEYSNGNRIRNGPLR
jgi:hypothetical protein